MTDLPDTVNVMIRFPETLPGPTFSGLWTPNAAERHAAWEMCIELSTRVAVVPLRNNEGLLSEALGSMHAIFGETRAILRGNGPDLAIHRRGELSFAVLAGHMLNQVLRPVTAFWHPRLAQWADSCDKSMGALEKEKSFPDHQRLRDILDAIRTPLTDFATVFAEASGAQEFLRIQLDNETRLYERFRREHVQAGEAPPA